eukprot:1131877_1
MPQTDYSVFFWISDISLSSMGIIISLIMLCILIRKTSHDKQIDWITSLLIYLSYLSFLYYFICTLLISTTLLIPNINAHHTCHILYYIAIPSVGCCNVTIFNLFIHRLYISFKETAFPLSSWTRYIFIIFISSAWLSICVIALFSVHATPYYHGIVASCSIHSHDDDSAVNSHYIEVLKLCCLGIILFAHVVIWGLFMIKLHKLLKHLHAASCPKFTKIMQEQTLLVGIVVFSSLLFWSLNVVRSFGQFLINIDIIINMSVIFVSFSFNKRFFRWFGCELLTKVCCRHVDINITVKKQNMERVITESVVDRNIELLGAETCATTNGQSANTIDASSDGPPPCKPQLHLSVSECDTSQTLPLPMRL